MSSSLNKEQEIAANHTKGPMLVIAGPGTGKTATLTARYVRLLKKGVSPENILAITFTKKASQELKERIAKNTKLPPNRISAGTIHGLARQLIFGFPDHFPNLKNRKLISENESRYIIRNIIKDFPIAEDDAVSQISGFKDQLLKPEDIFQILRSTNGEEKTLLEYYARTYQAYERIMLNQNTMDFGDLISGAVDNLKNNPEFLKTLSNKFKFVMVDEYQDINKAQHEFIKLLVSEHNNLWVVGDDDQSLYGWRFAELKYILDFQNEYPNAKIQTLVQNYRSLPIIIQAANALVSKNRNRYPKNLKPTRTGLEPVKVHAARTPEAEAEWIAQRIIELKNRGLEYKDIAILSRVGHNLIAFERALNKHNIPVEVIGAPPLWDTPSVRQALSTIQTLINYTIDPNLDPAPNWMIRKLEQKQRGKNLISNTKLVCNDMIQNPPRKYNSEQKAAWKYALEQLIAEVEQAQTPQELIKIIEKSRDPEIKQNHNAVQAITIHASKGLEWPAVFVTGLEQGVLPHVKSENLEEERRLAFVAITRPMVCLFLSYSEERNRRTTKTSPFINEILSGLPTDSIIKTSASGSSHSDGVTDSSAQTMRRALPPRP